MPREEIRALRCQAGGQAYCVEIGEVMAIERGEGMVPNREAGGPNGWIVRRGTRIPVYGLAELLDPRRLTTRAGAVLIVNRTNPWGMAVDRVERMAGGIAELQPLPEAASGPRSACLRGVVLEGDSLILVLAPEYLRAELAPPAPVTERSRPPLGPRTAEPTRGSVRGRLLLFAPPNPGGGTQAPSGRVLLGLSYSQTLEIVTGLRFTPVPSAPAHVLGLVPWRSRAVPVVDAGALLGFEPAAARADTRLVVVRSPRWRSQIALPVGVGLHARSLPLSHGPCPADLPLDLSCARGVFALGRDRVLVLPDLDLIAAPPARRATAAAGNS